MKNIEIEKEQLREKILELGADVCGFASIERFDGAPKGFHPRDVFPKCNSVISFGIALPKGLYLVDSRLIYSHFNEMTCPEVDQVAFQAAMYLEKNYSGIAVPLPCDGPYDYWDEEKKEGHGLISMKHAAFFSGMGAFGKNTMFMTPKYGNRLIVGCILTDLFFEPDQMQESVCLPQCNLCVDGCPVQAIGKGSVNQKLCRTHAYGNTKRGYATVECNQCRTVCPRRFGI